MIIEVVSKCFCGIDIPNAKDKDNVFVRNMKGALLHNTPQETWVFYVPSKGSHHIRIASKATSFLIIFF